MPDDTAPTAALAAYRRVIPVDALPGATRVAVDAAVIEAIAARCEVTADMLTDVIEVRRLGVGPCHEGYADALATIQRGLRQRAATLREGRPA